jgi:omega-3 fatty acid desaturase (delta-15 desaturase)
MSKTIKTKTADPIDSEKVLAAIPATCFEKNPITSVFYFLRDYLFMGILYFLYPYCNHWALKIVWWNVTGFFMWAIFVIGHDCGHGSFSDYTWLNEICGQIAHTSILVPFHGWRISHRDHHMKHNNIQQDKTFPPFDKEDYHSMPAHLKAVRFTYLMVFLFPIYLTLDYDSTAGNHFNPYNKKLFRSATEFWQGLSSTICITLWLSFLFYHFTVMQLIDAYFIPVIIFGWWLVVVTFLHHTDDKGTFYHEDEWTFLKGAATTFDRSFGWIIDHLHHDIGTHFVHHLFFTKIPHYHLVEATEHAKKALGDVYKKDDTPIFTAFNKSLSNCLWVEKDETGFKYKH